MVITLGKCEEANVSVILIKNSDLFWICARDISEKVCVTNMSNLILTQVRGYYDNKETYK